MNGKTITREEVARLSRPMRDQSDPPADRDCVRIVFHGNLKRLPPMEGIDIAGVKSVSEAVETLF